MRHVYPILLDVSDRLAVIIGGGEVAARKVKGLRDAGAQRVRVVAPKFSAAFASSIERIAQAYRAQHLDGAALAFAATDQPEVNDAVVRDARARGILVSRADAEDDEPGDFILPAKFVEGSATVTVSTGSPALAGLIRDELKTRWDPRWTKMGDAMAELRPILRDRSNLSRIQRQRIFRDLASEEALNALNEGGIEGLRNWLAQRPDMK